MISIVSYSDDAHADLVEKALQEGGFSDFVRLDLEQAHGSADLSITDHKWQIVTGHVKATVDSSNVTTVWWRRTGTRATPTSEALISEIDYTECYWAVRWLLESLPSSCFPFGHPNRLRAAENKLAQLSVARAVGFRVPATCISNNKAILTAFALGHEWLVVKPFYASVVRDEQGREQSLYAAPVERQLLVNKLEESAEPVQLLCQERIWKCRDVRVLFFPDGENFACEIDASALPKAEVDWRPNTMAYPHSIISLPATIQSKAAQYLARLGLTSGSFDFGITKDDEWVFFECNPNGQWLWMELKTGFELARKVASVLLNHHQNSLGRSLADQTQ